MNISPKRQVRVCVLALAFPSAMWGGLAAGSRQQRLRQQRDALQRDGTYSRGTYIQQSINRDLQRTQRTSLAPDAQLDESSDVHSVKPGMEIKLVPMVQYEAPSCAGDGSATFREECGICLAPFVSGEALRTPACGHRFHAKCLRIWFHTTPSCPTCRHVVAVDQPAESAPTSPEEARAVHRRILVPTSLLRRGRRSAPAQDTRRREPWPFLDY